MKAPSLDLDLDPDLGRLWKTQGIRARIGA